ncbi:response regulator [Azospirillum thermophilum]|uniref:Response regulator n=1 Tax=Azospirillum thermophilum TaxID=2202148 RepID=A0A2S2CZF4_9PROT|nr:response regulator [Azospirillum thermophilum]AWK89904.1 response regulator [Azospirillum thermophilum]
MTPTPPPPFRVLLVEDETLVAMAVEDALSMHGVEVVGPADSVPLALELVERGGFDGALLDVNLRGERVDQVADALAARGLPFIFTTGTGADGVPEGHRHRPVLTKPFRDAEMSAAIDEHLRPA